ncbi:MAG: TonB-dependent receptor [Chitinophagales bacterium]
MKKALFLFVLLFFSFSSFAQSINDISIQFNYENVSLENFIRDLETKNQISFSYGNINLNQKFSINYQGNLNDGLAEVCSLLNLKYKVINEQIVLRKSHLINLKSNIKGRVLDVETKAPIVGANIILLNHEPFTGTASDIDGYFGLKNLPIGRYSLQVNSLGYENRVFKEVLLTAAKDIFLEVYLNPSLSNIEEVVITASVNKFEASNEMATTSSRSFSIEETQRYAASVSDPARMAQNYAGVNHSGDDSSNDIVIRGNSPRGLLWRLEGVEMPNPNHYGDMGSKGGTISLLSSSTLTNSDFYTSSFPAQFGNSLSGVFDLKLRKGNNTKREHSFKIGILGIEAATEGYFSKKSKASYLFNYRFSTISLLGLVIKELKTENLFFQDFSGKIFIPTKKLGSFSIFGLGGINTDVTKAKQDSSQWVSPRDRLEYYEQQRMGIVGVSHKKVFNEKTQLQSSIAVSTNFQKWTVDLLDTIPQVSEKRVLLTDFNNINFIASSTFNHRFSKKHLIQAGIIGTNKFYNYFLLINQDNIDYIFFSNKDNTYFLQNFLQWKFKASNRFSFNLGYHFSYLFLNNSYAVDPRLGLKFRINEKHSIGFSTGIYSKPEHITTYLIRDQSSSSNLNPNMDLKMTKAFQSVLSYDVKLAKDFRLKTEFYYQYLFDVPVREDGKTNYSTLNAENVFSVIPDGNILGQKLISTGTGTNYGIDLTLEKFFSKQHYAMFTASLFDSYYTSTSGKKFRTDYANNYLFNLLGGKEFKVGKNKNNILAVNGKFIFNGGQRYTPIDIETSRLLEREVLDYDKINTKQFSPYYRVDLGFSYKMNTRNVTHSFLLDIQNISNNKNPTSTSFDLSTNQVFIDKQLGLLPFISYKIDFTTK